MSHFEYVTVITSLILGLGITRILTGVASLIMVHRRVRFYLPHILLVVLVFFLLLQEWWINYDNSRHVLAWRMLDFFFIIIYPILMFILSSMLFPSGIGKRPIDLREFYYENFPKFYGVSIFMPLLSIPQNIFILGLEWKSQLGQIAFLIIMIAFVWSRTRQALIHFAFTIFASIMALLYAVYINPEL